MTSNCASGPCSVTDDVKEYYGKTLKSSADLATDACTTGPVKMNKDVKQAMKEVHQEVVSRYYGCGIVIPELLNGMRVLDLGSGSGRDCYIISKLIGPEGHVTGIDMTEEQLKVANDYVAYHTEKFGYKKPNVDFVHGYIEKLGEAGLKDDSYDIIVSNCVVNLSPDKRAVLKEAHRVLKTGGELYFSDVYANKDLPEDIRKHKVLWGECVSGALYWKDLYSLAEEIGFSRPRLVTSRMFTITREDLKEVVGDAQFVSATYRLFKLPSEKKSACQLIYKGEIPNCEELLKFDHTVNMKPDNMYTADGELSTILQSSRFRGEFDFQPCGSGSGCCSVKDSGAVIDPFDYAVCTPAPSGGGCCS